MPEFSARSKERLGTCHTDLWVLFNEVIKDYDCVVLEGHRDQASQEQYFHDGKSQKKWPESKHNQTPSLAVDVAPYPLDWNNKNQFYHFAGFVLGLSKYLGIQIRWGGDWDGDRDFKDQTFLDLPHFELVHTESTTLPK